MVVMKWKKITKYIFIYFQIQKNILELQDKKQIKDGKMDMDIKNNQYIKRY